MTTYETVSGLVLLERKYQDKKWGVQNHSFEKWYLILTEEVGECAKAYLEAGEVITPEVVAEAMQVAAVAHAMIECFIRGKYEKKS